MVCASALKRLWSSGTADREILKHLSMGLLWERRAVDGFAGCVTHRLDVKDRSRQVTAAVSSSTREMAIRQRYQAIKCDSGYVSLGRDRHDVY